MTLLFLLIVAAMLVAVVVASSYAKLQKEPVRVRSTTATRRHRRR